MFFSYNNKEIALRKEAEAQRGKIKSVRDKVFKIIREKANVSTEYRKAFEKIYPDLRRRSCRYCVISFPPKSTR